jgi:putative N6-adenine-specific DNA methylase
MPSSIAAFAACLPGLEPLLAAELTELGLEPNVVAGGVEFAADVPALQRCGLWLGTASHVVVRLAQFRCRALGELERKAAMLPWTAWLRDDVALDVRATARKSRLFHTGAIEERIARAARDAVGDLPELAANSDAPAAKVAVRMFGDVCTVSLDIADTPLHRRGYRLEVAKAPLREDLAHALALAVRPTSADAILDPFCGSGTVAIEAAALQAGLPPGRLRRPPLEHLAAFDRNAWRKLLASVEASAPSAPIVAGDRDAGAIEAAKANAARAGVADAIQFGVAALRSQTWFAGDAPARGCLLTNPPFGVRVGKGPNLQPLYQSLGACAKRLGAGWRVGILAHDPRLARKTALPLRAAFTTKHGGLSVTAMVGDTAAAATSDESTQPTE